MRDIRDAATLLLAAPFVLTACGGGGGDAGQQIEFVEGARSEAAFPDARVTFEAPERGTVVDSSAVSVRLSVDGFALGAETPGVASRGLAVSGRGQHVHFFVDDQPYQALYDVSEPVELTGLEPGLHLLRAFPGRQWHESVKGTDAFALSWFFVRDSADAAWEPGAPLLTYSRPKGTYTGADADSIMVDFYLSNVEIGAGQDQHRVRLTVDDTLSWTITRWAPHYVLGLGDGDHTFRLELEAPDGTPVPGRFNAVERVITVERGAASGGG